MVIPIENIYYLLCYAWNKLEEKDRVNVSAVDFTQLADLFAKVLANGTKVLLKRGVDRSYKGVTSELAGVKGKISISETIKSNLLQKQRTICNYDEFSPEILINQILITTLKRLIRVRSLDLQIKDDIRTLLLMLPDIGIIELQSVHFRQVRFTRNNNFYRFLINVCEIIHQNLLPTEDPGELTFQDFTRDEHKMNQLFEAFIHNFYKLEQNTYPTVKSETIYWQFDQQIKKNDEYIPEMHTDITLENETKKIIIDAKYYRQTMTVNYEKERFHSNNMYQLFSYLINQEDNTFKTRSATGILLYPTVQQEYDLEYKYKMHRIEIKTVNLNTDWRSISARLKSLILNKS
jgi:5-methylcytosine-specific restriction enzyme subunit McrC